MSRMYESAQGAGGIPREIGAPHFHYVFAGATALIFHQAPECRRLFGIDPSSPDVVEAHADALCRLFLGDATIGRGAAPTPQGRKS